MKLVCVDDEYMTMQCIERQPWSVSSIRKLKVLASTNWKNDYQVSALSPGRSAWMSCVCISACVCLFARYPALNEQCEGNACTVGKNILY